MKPKKPDYDVDFARSPGLDQAQVASEMGHALRLRGYCTVKLGSSKETLAAYSSAFSELRQNDLLQPPPEELQDCFLGPEGTGAFARLDPAAETPPSVLLELRQRIRDFAQTAVSASAAKTAAPLLTEDYLVQGGGCEAEAALTEADCSEWIQTLSRARMMLIYFFGKGQGVLEIMPFSESPEGMTSIEFVTESDVLVILQSDISLHKHVSTRGMCALLSWVLGDGPSTIRGWTGSISRTFGAANPAVKELQEWSQERMEELAELQVAQQQGPLPREWERMVRHSYFKADTIPIAVRGQAGHHALTNDTHTWWSAVTTGTDMVVEVPFSRWGHFDGIYDPDPNCWMESVTFPGGGILKTSVKHVQFIEGSELFDNKFFGISNMEALGMDPMQRHVLETSYEALHGAGYRKPQLLRSYIAVFTGCTNPEYAYVPHDMGALSGAGASQAITSNRVSFQLGLMGPSTSIDCDLSSAAMAMTLGNSAVSNQNIRRNQSGGTSTAALISGVYFCLTPVMWPRWNAFMNPAGRAFSFDQQANGYVVGEGCLTVVLKPYAEKVEQELVVANEPSVGNMVGWHIVNNGRNAGLAAPSGPMEQEVIAESFRMAGLSPLDVDGMECHAEGSRLSDAVELSACVAVLRRCEGGDKEMLIFGSCKANTGVQREACFMSGFLKVMLNMRYANNPPAIHLKQLNPYFEAGDAAHCINTESMPYRDSRVFHGIGSRGWGGTSINLVCWGAADASIVPVSRPKLFRRSFAYWPADAEKTEEVTSYYLAGSWNNWQPQPMSRGSDGCFTGTVTLGPEGFESFQVWVEGDSRQVLHPDRPNAASGSRALGPDPLDLIQQYHLNWLIDGRALAGRESALTPTQLPQPAELARARDAGEPGDEYQVKLWSGKFQAVAWERRKPAF